MLGQEFVLILWHTVILTISLWSGRKMALIKKEQSINKSDLRIKIPTNVKNEVDAYCEWTGIQDIGYFFAEAANMVFSRDNRVAEGATKCP